MFLPIHLRLRILRQFRINKQWLDVKALSIWNGLRWNVIHVEKRLGHIQAGDVGVSDTEKTLPSNESMC